MRLLSWKMRALLTAIAFGLQAGMLAADDGVTDENTRGSARKHVFSQLTGLVETFSDRRTAPATLPAEPVLPARLGCVRVSRALLEQYVDRDVDCEQELTDSILGVDLTGRSQTRGRIHLVLQPSETSALAEVVFEGTIESNSTGRKGPATLQIKATTHFTARKQLLITAEGVTVTPSTATAQTTSETTDVATKSGGMRGRLVERVARRRSDEMRDEANTIAAAHAAEQVKQALDAQVDEAVAESQTTLTRLLNGRGGANHQLAWRSTADYVEVHLVREGAVADANGISPPAFEGNPGIAARLHHSVVKRALADPQLIRTFGPLLSALELDQRDSRPNKPASFTWSPGRTWLVVDHAGPKARLTSATEKVAPFGAPMLNLEPTPRLADSKP